MEIDIFERVRKRLATGKDFDPQMVIDLCRAYDEEISKLKAAQPPRAADDSLVERQRSKANRHAKTSFE